MSRDRNRLTIEEDEHGWQPIETAPRDGRAHLLFTRGYAVLGYWHRPSSRWESLPNWEAIEPTHWQRLPPPPIGGAE